MTVVRFELMVSTLGWVFIIEGGCWPWSTWTKAGIVIKKKKTKKKDAC